MTAGPAASRRVGINGRTSPPPDSSLPEVCSFQLPKVCSFRLPLTDPSDPAPYLSLGVSYEGLDRRSDAVGAYRRYLDLAPASPTSTALKWHVVAIMESQERARAGG